jgi:uncharacterized protein (UPF0332 family)
LSDRLSLLRKADRYLDSAELLASSGDDDSAVSRAHYAALFLAEVLPDVLGQSFSSHRALISAYGQEFAKTGRLDARFHRTLIAAFEERQQADYLPKSGLIAADVAALVNDIRQFRSATVAWLDGQSPKFCPPTNNDD